MDCNELAEYWYWKKEGRGDDRKDNRQSRLVWNSMHAPLAVSEWKLRDSPTTKISQTESIYIRRSVLQYKCSGGERLKVQVFPHTLPGRFWVARSRSATLCFIFLTTKGAFITTGYRETDLYPECSNTYTHTQMQTEGGKKRESELGGLVALNSMPMYEKRHMYVVTKLGKTVTRVKATLKTNTSWWDLSGGGLRQMTCMCTLSHTETLRIHWQPCDNALLAPEHSSAGVWWLCSTTGSVSRPIEGGGSVTFSLLQQRPQGNLMKLNY